MFDSDNSYINARFYRLGIAYTNALLILPNLLVVLLPESFYMINSYKEQGILKVGNETEWGFCYSYKFDVLSCVDLFGSMAS